MWVCMIFMTRAEIRLNATTPTTKLNYSATAQLLETVGMGFKGGEGEAMRHTLKSSCTSRRTCCAFT